MKVISLILVQYNRLSLRHIRYFEYRPTAKTQAILGTNGSGKSSILKELSPLPAIATEYGPEGMKEIVYSHKGSIYTLNSAVDPETGKWKYTFIKDDEVLNPGFGIVSYRELVKEHFNYTEDVHSLMTGETRFHEMSVAERRSWLTRLSQTDFTYALRYFKKLSEETRDLQGSITLTQRRLAVELEKAMSKTEEAELDLRLGKEKEILDFLLDRKRPRPVLDERDYSQQITTTAESIESVLRVMESVDSLYTYRSADDFQTATIQLLTTKRVLETEIANQVKQIEQYQKTETQVKAASTSNLDTVRRAIESLEKECEDLVRYIHLDLWFERPREALSEYEVYQELIASQLTALAEFHEVRYTEAQVHGLRENVIPLLEQRLRVLKGEDERLSLAIKDLELSKSKGETTCPSCTYRWIPNFNEAAYERALQERTQCREKQVAFQTELTGHSKTLEEGLRYLSHLSELRRTARAAPAMAAYFNYLFHQIEAEKPYQTLLTEVPLVKVDLLKFLKRDQLREMITEKQKFLDSIATGETADLEKLSAALHTEELALSKKQTEFGQTLRAIAELEQLKKLHGTLMTLEADFTRLMASRDSALKTKLEYLQVQLLDEMIRHSKSTLSELELRKSHVRTHQAQLQSLQATIDTSTQRHELMKLAMAALSPTEGLIARGMSAFINHFLSQVNAFIESIWIYPLVLLPVEVSAEDELDLTYRFKVMANDEYSAPDVAKTSMAQRAIIDHAFTAVSMIFLGLEHAPLFLDEFGSSMDYKHRLAAFQAVDALADNENYSQIFLISHYTQGYGSLANTETLVLCDANISLPEGAVFNRHAILRS